MADRRKLAKDWKAFGKAKGRSRRSNADVYFRVRPKANYDLLGTPIKLDRAKTYWAMAATNQPGWKAKGLIFIMTDPDGTPASKANLEWAQGFLLEKGEYTKSRKATSRRKNKLSQAKRKKLPASQFAIPSERIFPIQSKKQAEVALTYADWPNNAKHKAAVRRAVFKKYPSLKPGAKRRNPARKAPARKKNTGGSAVVFRATTAGSKYQIVVTRESTPLSGGRRGSSYKIVELTSGRLAGSGSGYTKDEMVKTVDSRLRESKRIDGINYRVTKDTLRPKARKAPARKKNSGPEKWTISAEMEGRRIVATSNRGRIFTGTNYGDGTVGFDHLPPKAVQAKMQTAARKLRERDIQAERGRRVAAGLPLAKRRKRNAMSDRQYDSVMAHAGRESRKVQAEIGVRDRRRGRGRTASGDFTLREQAVILLQELGWHIEAGPRYDYAYTPNRWGKDSNLRYRISSTHVKAQRKYGGPSGRYADASAKAMTLSAALTKLARKHGRAANVTATEHSERVERLERRQKGERKLAGMKRRWALDESIRTKTTARERVMAHFKRLGWTITRGGKNSYAYPPGRDPKTAQDRYRIGGRSIRSQGRAGRGWVDGPKTMTLTEACDRLGKR